MAWNRIIKTVKGHSYAYMQRSFRDGGKVRTESRYIGPVSGENAGGPSAPPPPEPPAAAPPEPPPVITTNQPPAVRGRAAGLRLRFDTKERGICPERLGREYGRVRGWAEGLGVPADSFPAIAVRKGATARARRSWVGSGRVLTVPPKGGRKTARKAFGEALGHSFLDSVREANPFAFQVLANHLEPSYRTTNRLFLAALTAGGEHSRFALSLQIHFFGRIHPIAKLPAGHIGLACYGERGSWRDEAAAIIGEVATQGYRHALASRTEATAAALRRERAARKKLEKATLFDRISGKRRALKRALVGATAARMATEEAARKLQIIARLLPEVAR